jgi:hypothetical protein
MREIVFAFTHETPDREALIVHPNGYGCDICWPITTEAEAYKLAKRVGVFGFWRLKSRKPRPHLAALQRSEG